MTTKMQRKRRIADQLQSEVKRLNEIQIKADKLGVFIPILDLGRLAIEFERVAKLIDESLDSQAWKRDAK